MSLSAFRIFLVCSAFFLHRSNAGIAPESDAPPKKESLIPDEGKINRTLPFFEAPKKISLSKDSPVSDFRKAGLLPIPLIGTKNSREDNADLVASLDSYNKDDGNIALLDQYVREHPNSDWNVSLLANIAKKRFQAGQFQSAMEAWKKVWQIGKLATDPEIKSLVDLGAVEYARLNMRVGRVDEVQQVLAELKNRPLTGPATEMITGVSEGLWLMKNRPEKAFLCGPMAVSSLFSFQNPGLPFPPVLENAQSTSQGTSLPQLKKLAAEAGMNYQMAFRKDGDLIFPSIVHWKVGHWAALIERKDGRVMAADPVFGGTFWIEEQTLKDENTGYFLIPAGSLSKGWRAVGENEAGEIWGKGGTVATDPDSITPQDHKCPRCEDTHGMAVANAHLAVVSLNIVDTPLAYQPPRGPAVEFRLTYNQRESNQPAVFGYTNFGPKWTCDWITYLAYDPQNPYGDIGLYVSGGGYEEFHSAVTQEWIYLPSPNTRSFVSRISSGNFEVLRKDGTREIFSVPVDAGQRLLRSKIIDPRGNSLAFSYDSDKRLVAVTDELGQVTTIGYEMSGDPRKVTRVTDPFGRSTFLEYDLNGTAAKLKKITDVIGIVSEFTYNSSGNTDFINKLTTPYGNTVFAYGDVAGGSSTSNRQRWLEITDPLGGKERVEFDDVDGATGVPQTLGSNMIPLSPSGTNYNSASPYNNWLDARNTFYWSKKAMAMSPTHAYSFARIYHWKHADNSFLHDGQAHSPYSNDVSSGVLDSIQDPQDANYPQDPQTSRLWFLTASDYQSRASNNNQTVAILRRVDYANPTNAPASTQAWRYKYNDAGQVILQLDPQKRTTSYKYADNKIDLLAVYRWKPGGAVLDANNVASDLLMTLGDYNTLHQPTTVIDSAGQIVNYSFGPKGQLLTRKVKRNSVFETTTWNYTGDYVTSITNPLGAIAESYSYDQLGRVRSIADSEGYVLTYEYDALNRLTKTTFPDGTYTQTIFNRLDPEWTRDRLGRWTRREYNAARLLVKETDPKNRAAYYSRCTCGALDAIIDAKGNSTEFVTDLLGRVKFKKFGGVTAFSYYYDLVGRLSSQVDAKGQRTTFNYNFDDNVQNVAYTLEPTHAADVVATPGVSYLYDPVYDRATDMTDGTGTTHFTYKPAGVLGANQLATAEGPLAGGGDDLHYAYDELGRMVSSSINGVGSSIVYDALGRMTSTTNPLGLFNYYYVNQSGRLSSVSKPGGSSVSYGYYPNTGDQRLAEINNLGPSSAPLSKFNYVYNAVGNISKWTQQIGGGAAQYYDLSYDKADQLLSAHLKDAATNTILAPYTYRYDPAGNRTDAQADGAVTTAGFNSLNQLKTWAGGGTMTLVGAVSEPATLMVNGKWTPLTSANQFSATIQAAAGSNSIPLTATDASGNTTNKTLQFTITEPAATLLYDLNGNLTDDGVKTYEWDAENRLVAINYLGTNQRTEFSYDGEDRRIQIVEKANGVATSTKKFIWIGWAPAEERDGSNNVIKRFYDEGEQIGGTSYLFTRDHLGSVREMTNLSGAVQARYSYDPYGQRNKLSGAQDADFGYTGHYHHAPSSLSLTLYRAYNSKRGSWLSRDPVGEDGGLNLYQYALNDPVNLVDPDGRCPLIIIPFIYAPVWMPYAAAAAGGLVAGTFAGMAAEDYLQNNQAKQNEPEVAPKGKGGYRANPPSDPKPGRSRNADRKGHKRHKNSDKHSASQGYGGKLPPGFK